ncbi:hypothetical protein CFter6_3514 [Collimonas fungivorans]|uniref:Uncharacterized protein n=1 Tax=Collimonas fungivorans TaxID=158899 RepID=A0A127PEF5_9BURK|nr:hypothetical protein CFter6_3514 [Collimonas fungivorans]
MPIASPKVNNRTIDFPITAGQIPPPKSHFFGQKILWEAAMWELCAKLALQIERCS